MGALICALVLVFVTVYVILPFPVILKEAQPTEGSIQMREYRLSSIPNIEKVFSSVGKTDRSNFDLENSRAEIQAAILPHHTDIGDKLDEFWSEIALRSEPEVIVIVGPAHWDQGSAEVQTTTGIWETPFGDVETNNKLIKKLSLAVERESFENEHSIGVHAPYIANYFPDVQIIPVIAKSRAGLTGASELVSKLTRLNKKVLLIASIDFSHYLSEAQSLANDVEVQEVIAEKDFDGIDQMNSDYLDSSFALDVFLLWQNATGCLSQARWHDYNPAGTSYLVYDCSASPVLRISAVGDIMLARGVENRLLHSTSGRMYSEAARKTDVLMELVSENSDIIFGNLESVLSDVGKPIQKAYVFEAEPKFVDLLTHWGFSHLSVSNNHSEDFGKSAWEQSVDILKTNGIVPVGGFSNEPTVESTKINNKKIAILGFQNLTVPFYENKVLSAISDAANENDLTVVSMHWGNEYETQPDAKTVALAHKMINAGANIILGHHPHVLQPIERYKNGLIFYSLGNFIFDQSGEKQNTSLIALIDIFEDGLAYSTTPVDIVDFFPELGSRVEK